MPFGLTIGTERATALQQSIQDELTRRNYSAEPDAVMAEYITIMIINNKTSAQITSELEDLIGTDFDPSFTDWLFAEAAKGAGETPAPAQAEPSTSRVPEPAPQAAAPPATDSSRRPRNGVYQQAISQAIPSTSPAGQKRSASARSPSPTHSNKIRRTDVPTGPRAMLRDGPSNPRSLLDRVGGPGGAPMRNNFGQDDIQSRIDNIVNNPTPEQQQAMMMNAGFPMGMDMMNPGMANPIMLQEMMMNQMALMAQMASTMGIINPATGQFGGPAFGGMPGDMSMYPGGMDGFQGPMGGNGNHSGRGRGNARGRGIGRGNGRGGPPGPAPPKAAPDAASAASPVSGPSAAIPIVAPTPAPAAPNPVPAATGGLTGFVLPERPQSPTLCKFGLKCTNAHCRYSHASPVATPESGVVLSNEASVLNPQGRFDISSFFTFSPVFSFQLPPSPPPAPAHHQPPPAHHQAPAAGVPCRYGVGCTRAGCTFTHPPGHPSNATSNPRFAQPCHFGAGCTRADCHFQHPEGRVLPTTFHRGLSTSAPLVSVPNPETGSMGAASHHRSVTFNQSSGGNASVKEKLEKQMKEIEEKKSQAEKAVKAAEEAAANAKKEKDVKAVTISA
ncbi:hypothetical protein MVEN_00568600 [Mycena venus]|uniref:C3H1-type domain-containing protein n=1 Tax=Mycena venus TaxID=2733690 RepID=A0A8H6YPM8_9AGAR|nr:hypothetical protein MVEN_00568600 [Mycena venus]